MAWSKEAIEAAYQSLVRDCGYHRDSLTRALNAASAIDGADGVLPCDVLLPPRTVIRRGCNFATLRTALAQREKQGWPEDAKHFPRPVDATNQAAIDGDYNAGVEACEAKLTRLLDNITREFGECIRSTNIREALEAIQTIKRTP